jgi:hypothetical protein
MSKKRRIVSLYLFSSPQNNACSACTLPTLWMLLPSSVMQTNQEFNIEVSLGLIFFIWEARFLNILCVTRILLTYLIYWMVSKDS